MIGNKELVRYLVTCQISGQISDFVEHSDKNVFECRH